MYAVRSLKALVACLALAYVHSFSPSANAKGSTSIATAATTGSGSDGGPLVGDFSRRQIMSVLTSSVSVAAGILAWPMAATARLESVNRPELLPTEKNLSVIQVEKFLTSGQAKRMNQQLTALERDTGYRVRVLCQAYPQTPGLAIRDYWDLGQEGQKDDKYVVLVVDQFGGKGNVLNFNVGEGVKLTLPNVFWTRLQAKFGTVRCVG